MLSEIKPTPLRILKIVWSHFWRLTLVIIPFFYFNKILGTSFFDYEDQLPFRHIHDPLMIQLKNVAEEFIAELLGFFLIMGIRYKDFIFDFSPKLTQETKDYWESLARVSWAYSWRAIFFEYSATIIFTLIALPFTPSSMDAIRFLMSIVARVIIFRLIVNKEYGNARLSLLGNGSTPDQ